MNLNLNKMFNMRVNSSYFNRKVRRKKERKNNEINVWKESSQEIKEKYKKYRNW